MSWVTNIVLLGNTGAFEGKTFRGLQRIIADRFRGQEFCIMRHEVGGHKSLESDVAIAAFNHADPQFVREAIKAGPWPEDTHIHMAVCDQEDWSWTVEKIVGDDASRRSR